jgi:hypothetical protein
MKRCGEKIDETRGRKDSMLAAKKKVLLCGGRDR